MKIRLPFEKIQKQIVSLFSIFMSFAWVIFW